MVLGAPVKIKFRIILAVVFLAASIVISYFLFFRTDTIETPHAQPPEEYYSKLDNSGKEFTIAFQDDLQVIVDELGIEGAMYLLEMGEREGKVNMVNCHPLIHLVGHEAQKGKIENLPRLLEQYAAKCQKAFPHGIEAQIALEEGNAVDRSLKLREACDLYQEVSGGATCYHGAGHAFYQKTNDAGEAVKYCDAIRDDDLESIKDCYRGIFSELGNQVLGIDGETGLPIPGPKKELDNPDLPLLHCMQYSEQYQESCVSQLTKVAVSDMQSSGDLSPCLYDEYNPMTKSTCIKIFGGMTSRGFLTDKDSYVIPDEVLQLSTQLQNSYILGIQDSLIGYSNDGIRKDWGALCAQFKGQVKTYCSDQLSVTQRGEGSL